MKKLGELTLAGHRFPVHESTFRFCGTDEDGKPSWEFEISTGPPLVDPADSTESFLFSKRVRFYAEGDPIPLPDQEDYTGVEVYIEEPCDPDSGEVYFTLYVSEHENVSHVRLKFVERRGSKYRIQVSGLAHNVFEKPIKLTIDTWITRLPHE
jgi:hypothetical protein